MRAAERKRVDRAVEDGDLTRKHAEAMLSHLEEHLERLGEGPPFGPPPGARHGGPPGPLPGAGFGPDGDFHPPEARRRP